MATKSTTTHERYVQAVREAVIAQALAAGTITAEESERLAHTKVVYGVGDGSYRGICYYQAWENGVGRVDVVEIAATAQESFVQLAGTVVHELAHVLASGDGHGAAWKETGTRLGFKIKPNASGQTYHLAMFTTSLRHRIHALASEIGDGTPAFRTFGLGPSGPVAPYVTIAPRPCSMGIGTKGGTSRGKGSGSRLRLWECECDKPVKVRIASDDFRAHCDVCGEAFTRQS